MDLAVCQPSNVALLSFQAYAEVVEFEAPDELYEYGAEQCDGFGETVALSGSTLIVGAPQHGRGAAYLFVRTPRPSGPDSADGW